MKPPHAAPFGTPHHPLVSPSLDFLLHQQSPTPLTSLLLPLGRSWTTSFWTTRTSGACTMWTPFSCSPSSAGSRRAHGFGFMFLMRRLCVGFLCSTRLRGSPSGFSQRGCPAGSRGLGRRRAGVPRRQLERRQAGAAADAARAAAHAVAGCERARAAGRAEPDAAGLHGGVQLRGAPWLAGASAAMITTMGDYCSYECCW